MNKDNNLDEIFSNCIRSGKRTYFFDVRKTRNEEYYLTITESIKKYEEDGSFKYQKHKIFLYKKDFENFGKSLSDTFQKIIELSAEKDKKIKDEISKDFTDLNFEDLKDID